MHRSVAGNVCYFFYSLLIEFSDKDVKPFAAGNVFVAPLS